MNWRQHLGAGGLIGAACAVCCVPPLIASLGVVAGLAATAGLIGGIAAAVAVLLFGLGVVMRRRTRPSSCSGGRSDQVQIAAPSCRH